MMINIDPKSRIPVYEQIKNQIMLLIQTGILSANDQLPSIRSLSHDISVNVNTVKRAFAELEAMGVIYSVPGKGSFVNDNAFSNLRIKSNALEEIKTAIISAIPKGVKKADVMEILNLIYGGDNND